MDNDLELAVGQRSDRGRTRSANEDSLGVPPPNIDSELLTSKGWLYVVADGIGGQVAGKFASDLAVREVVDRYYSDPSADIRLSLVSAVRAANTRIYERAQAP